MSSIKNEDKDSLFSKSSKKFQGTGDSQQIPNSISMKSFSSKSNAEDEKAALYKKQIELTIQELKNGNLTSGFEDLSLSIQFLLTPSSQGCEASIQRNISKIL